MPAPLAQARRVPRRSDPVSYVRDFRVQAEGRAIPIRRALRLDQDQDLGVEGRQPVPREALRETGAELRPRLPGSTDLHRISAATVA